MKVKILGNISYQTQPIVDGMVEIDDELVKRIGIDKQFDKNGNIIDYVDNSKKVLELTNWFDNYFDKQLKQSQWQKNFKVSQDPYFKDEKGKPRIYADIEELKAQAELVRVLINSLRDEV
jgi:hypothetical protein